MSTTPGMIASAVSASCQLSENRMMTAITSRTSEIAGDMIAICSSPVVVSTSPVMRDRMPPVFMSHSRGSGRCSSLSKSARRSDSMMRVFRTFWR